MNQYTISVKPENKTKKHIYGQILFDLDRFLESININEANADIDGIVRINSNSNSDIAAAIWSKLNLMLEAGEDHDGDDDFDDHED